MMCPAKARPFALVGGLWLGTGLEGGDTEQPSHKMKDSCCLKQNTYLLNIQTTIKLTVKSFAQKI